MNYGLRIFLILILTILSADVKSQTQFNGEKYAFGFNGGLCSTILEFFPDSVMRRNTGCESSGRNSFHKYYFSNDTLNVYSGFTNIPKIKYSIDKQKVKGEKMRITFYDMDNNNVTKYFKCKWQRSGGRNYYIRYNDSLSAMTSKRMVEADLIFTTLEQVTKKEVRLSELDSNYADIKVTISIPEIYYKYQLLKYPFNKSNHVNRYVINEESDLVCLNCQSYPFEKKEIIFKLLE